MIKSKIISNLTIFAVILVMTLPVLVSAQPFREEFGGLGGSGTKVDASNPLVDCTDVDSCNWNALMKTLNKVKDYGLQLAVLASVIFIVYAGGLYLIANGDSGKIQTAHRILQNVVIGFFLVAAGWLIINAITKTLNVDDELLPGGFDR